MIITGGANIVPAEVECAKVPKTVEFIDEIPRTTATKVNRSAMIEARGG
jgi:acyl-coenzyme A synthetase/AMP-(fatty) acid ligase